MGQLVKSLPIHLHRTGSLQTLGGVQWRLLPKDSIHSNTGLGALTSGPPTPPLAVNPVTAEMILRGSLPIRTLRTPRLENAGVEIALVRTVQTLGGVLGWCGASLTFHTGDTYSHQRNEHRPGGCRGNKYYKYNEGCTRQCPHCQLAACIQPCRLKSSGSKTAFVIWALAFWVLSFFCQLYFLYVGRWCYNATITNATNTNY